MICAPDGGIIDDLIVYRLGPERFLVVANAAQRAGRQRRACRAPRRTSRPSSTTGRWRRPRRDPGSALASTSSTADHDVDLDALRYYAIAEGTVAGIPALVARTGYTGRGRLRGVRRERAGRASSGMRCSAAGAADGLVPVGLGARDTLRLEAGMPLYGNELDRDDDPVRGRPGAGRQARQAGRLRRSGRPRAGRRATDRAEAARRAASSRAAGSPATAIRSTPASGGPAS